LGDRQLNQETLSQILTFFKRNGLKVFFSSHCLFHTVFLFRNPRRHLVEKPLLFFDWAKR
jgi:hypothetical protein